MRYLVIIGLVLLIHGCAVQKNSVQSKLPKVAVTNWAEVAYYLPAGFWNETKSKEIISNIGAEHFEKVKTYSDLNMIPCQFLIFCGSGKKKPIPELRTKLEKLTAYELTSFHNITNDGVDRGQISILMVPYKGNEKWDADATWDTVYFLINKNLVTQVR